MKKIGKIVKFNGLFGKIEEADDTVEFSKNDLENENIEIGDIVIYRKEFREPNIKLARYVKVLEKNNDNKITD